MPDLYCIEVYLFSTDQWRFLSGNYVEFCLTFPAAIEMIVGFCPSFCLYDICYLLISVCQTIPTSRE